MKHTRIAMSSMLAVAAIATAACGGSQAEDVHTGQTAPSDTSVTEAPPAVTEPATPGGTKLAVGGRAVIPYDDSIDSGTVAVTVTAIEVGDQAAYEEKFGGDAKTTVPYYIRYTVENVGGTDLTTKNLLTLSGILADDSGTGVFITGGLPDCQSRISPSDFDKAGAKYDTCKLAAAGQGEEIVAAKYDGGDYDDNPIIWHK